MDNNKHPPFDGNDIPDELLRMKGTQLYDLDFFGNKNGFRGFGKEHNPEMHQFHFGEETQKFWEQYHIKKFH